MPKNILIFSDGTGQAGGVRPDQNLSNVYKLYRATRVSADNAIDPTKQVCFYDPGLGTQSEASGLRIHLVDRVIQVLGSLAGSGITENIIDCYEAILRLYEPGDRIYIFGFSRGAYTARSLASVLNLCGIPTSLENGDALPTGGKTLRDIADEAVRKVYEHGAGRTRSEFEEEREELALRFRTRYQSEEINVPSGTSKRGNVAPEFVGVFDTVAALGSTGKRRVLLVGALSAVLVTALIVIARIVEIFLGGGFLPLFLGGLAIASIWIARHLVHSRRKVFQDAKLGSKPRIHYASWKARNYDRFLDTRTGYARQALAIDETRVDFTQVGWGHSSDVLKHENDPIKWLKQVWFAGNHSDIGGSYPENESRLSDIALQWMIDEATSIPFPIEIDNTKLKIYPSVEGQQHCEVERVKERLGAFSKRVGWSSAPRKIASGAELHPTVLERFKLPRVRHFTAWAPYRPESLRHHELVAHFYEEPSNSSIV